MMQLPAPVKLTTPALIVQAPAVLVASIENVTGLTEPPPEAEGA
jgi:hypothetical protein